MVDQKKPAAEQNYKANRAEAGVLLNQLYPQNKLGLNETITKFRKDNGIAENAPNDDARMAQTVEAMRAKVDGMNMQKAAPTAAAAPAAAKDPEVEKAQGYLRALGITEVDVNGQKKNIDVNGVNDATFSAGLAKYKADKGMDANAAFPDVMKNMESNIQSDPAVKSRLQATALLGSGASPADVSSLQVVLNLLMTFISAITGGKLNVDGKFGDKTKASYNQLAASQPGMQLSPVGPKVDAAAPKPDTGVNTTTGVQAENDEQRRDRLGLTEFQYTKLAGEESEWQADARQFDGGGAVGDSPFIRADRQDRSAQAYLGIDDNKWQALKKQNADWQNKVDAGDTTVPKTGPLQQAYADKMESGLRNLLKEPASSPPTYRERDVDGKPAAVNPLMTEPPSSRSEYRPQRNQESRGDGGEYQQGRRGYGSSRFNEASGARAVNETLAARRELVESAFMTPQDAKQQVLMERKRELGLQGYSRIDAANQAGLESRMADRAERTAGRYEQRNEQRMDSYDRRAGMQADRYDRQAEMQVQREDRRSQLEAERAERRQAVEHRRDVAESRRDWGNLARGGVILNGGSAREANGARDVFGSLAGVIGGMDQGSGRGSSAQQRQADKQFGADMGNLARGFAILDGANSREAGALRDVFRSATTIFQRGGFGIPGFSGGESTQVFTAPQRGGYVPRDGVQGFSLDRSNQISPVQVGAASFGQEGRGRQAIFQAGMEEQARMGTPEERGPQQQRVRPSTNDYIGG